MGGNTALQSGRRLQWVKGIILMTPYDPSYYLLHGQGERFRGLIEEGSVLQSDGLEAIYKDADAHKEAYCFADAFEDVKDRNMCIVVGGGDDIAPGKLACVEAVQAQLSAFGSPSSLRDSDNSCKPPGDAI